MNEFDEARKMMPLTETSFYVLISLLEPLHGYAIMQKVERLSGGRIIYGPGTLYGALNNLENLGLIAICDLSVDSKKKKTYLITSKGKLLINLEIKRLEEMVKNARMLSNEAKQNEEV